jgi:hypothetical protein
VKKHLINFLISKLKIGADKELLSIIGTELLNEYYGEYTTQYLQDSDIALKCLEEVIEFRDYNSGNHGLPYSEVKHGVDYVVKANTRKYALLKIENGRIDFFSTVRSNIPSKSHARITEFFCEKGIGATKLFFNSVNNQELPNGVQKEITIWHSKNSHL